MRSFLFLYGKLDTGSRPSVVDNWYWCTIFYTLDFFTKLVSSWQRFNCLIMMLHSSVCRCSSRGTCILDFLSVTSILAKHYVNSSSFYFVIDVETFHCLSIIHVFNTNVESRYIVILVGIIFISFHVVSLYQRFNSLLKIWRFHRKLQLIVKFSQ